MYIIYYIIYEMYKVHTMYHSILIKTYTYYLPILLKKHTCEDKCVL